MQISDSETHLINTWIGTVPFAEKMTEYQGIVCESHEGPIPSSSMTRS